MSTENSGKNSPYFPFAAETHILSPDAQQIVDAIAWLHEVVAGGIGLGNHKPYLFLRIEPCTLEFAERLKIVTRFPPWTRVLWEVENPVAGVLASLELRFEHRFLGLEVTYVIDEYKRVKGDS